MHQSKILEAVDERPDARWRRVGVSILFAVSMLIVAGCSKPNPNLKIFAKGREYEYKASYYSAENELLTENTVKLSGTGKPWKYAPDRQSLIVYRYEYNADHQRAYSPHPLNPSAHRKWVTRATTGAIEQPNGVWIHPIRENQFLSTEVAPFPQVPLPLKVGNVYTSKLPIPKGQWGDWGGMTVNCRYQVLAKEQREFAFAHEPIECWKVASESEIELGKSKLTFYFHEDYGFVQMDYTNYVGERIKFVMQKATAPISTH